MQHITGYGAPTPYSDPWTSGDDVGLDIHSLTGEDLLAYVSHYWLRAGDLRGLMLSI